MSSPTLTSNAKSSDPRLCIVTRDEKGYGLTVHGKKPVIVQVVRAEGAAWKAGIREHDEILEVNGVSVENMDHNEVVNRIKQRNVVEFKVVTGQGRRHRNGTPSQKKRTQISRQTITTTTCSHQTVGDSTSVDPEKLHQLCQQSHETGRRSLKAAQQVCQELQQQVKCHPNDSDLRQRQELARQQVERLTNIVEEPGQPSFRASVSVSESSPNFSSVSSSLVLSPSSSSTTSSSSPASSVRPWVSVAQQAASYSPLIVPVLEEPCVEVKVELPLSHSKSCSMPEQSNSAAVRVAARSKSDTHEKRRPVSMDVSSLRLPAAVPSPPTTPVPTSTKTFKNHDSPRFLTVFRGRPSRSVSQPQGMDVAGEDLSGATTPDPISEEVPCHRRTSSLEAFGPGNSDGSPRIPKKSAQLIIPDNEMEEDEDEYQAAEMEVKLFKDFDKVLESPAACSKLISYAFTTSMTPEGELNLNRILFIIVMLDFQHCQDSVEKSDFMKDVRRITYEIYSTFLARTSPLNVELDESFRQELATKMQRDDEDRPNSLRSSLRNANEYIRASCDLLARFQRDLKNGMDKVLTQSKGALRHMMPREDQVRFMEQTLKVHVEHVNRWPDTTRKSAVASALATVYKFYQGGDEKSHYRSMESLVLGSTATFNTKLSKSRSVIPNLTRRGKVAFNGHSLSMKTVDVEVNCEVCNSIICGPAPQSEVCHHCGLNFHKECRPQYKKPCDRSKRTSIFSTFRQDKAKPKESFGSNWGASTPIRQSQSMQGLHRAGAKSSQSTSDLSSIAVAADSKERSRRMGSREGSAELPQVSATSPASSSLQRQPSFRGTQGTVSRYVESFEKQISNSVDEDVPTRTDSFETSLGRSESLKTPPVSRPSVTAWRNKSFLEHFEIPNVDCSQHGDVISEAESLQPGSSSDSIGQTSITSGASQPQDAEAKENEVRQKLEEDPLMAGLPVDVEHYIEDFGFRSYYDRLTRDGNKKNKDFKDYQIACCEMYFQELSHIRNLKIMQLMYVEQWPSGADDLKAAMGLDKLVTLIQLREELIELLNKRLDMKEKKFSNMGAAYEEWLNETRSVQLKVLLGCIRYKGENHFDKLLQERYKRVGWLVERTYNKLNLFDMMISVNQHACRPSLHLNTVKKSLSKMQKAEKGTNVYTRELETWKSAESRLIEVAGYLNDLKQKVVDLIPKVDATKLHASLPNRQLPNCYKDIPRTLNCFYFRRDVDCTVRLQQEPKSKDARLLVFEPFCIFLYVDANNPDRFVLRQWDRIPAVIQFTSVAHVMKDNTTKKCFIIFLDVGEEKPREDPNNRMSRSGNGMLGVVVTVKADDASVDKLFRLFTQQAAINKKSSADRRQGMGSSMSLSHSRNQRSNSTVSMQSALASLESHRGSLKDSTPAEDMPEEETMSAPNRLVAAVEDYKKSAMKEYSISEDYDQMVDVVQNHGARDNIELHLLLINHLEQLTDIVKEVGDRSDSQGAKKDEDISAKLKQFLTGLESTVKSYVEPEDNPQRTPVNSVFEEVIQEETRASLAAVPLRSSSDQAEEEADEVSLDDDDVEQGPASIQDDETAKELSSDEESSERLESTMKESDDDAVVMFARDFVQRVIGVALQRVSREEMAEEADISLLTSG